MSSLLIKQIADRLNLPPDEVDVAVREWTDALRDRVAQEGQATLLGLGVFQRQGQHLTFEPEEALSEAVNYRFAGLQTVVIEASPGYVSASEEVTTDAEEVAVPPSRTTASPPRERHPPPLEQRPTEEDASLSAELRTPPMRGSETTPLDDDRGIVQEHGEVPEKLTASSPAVPARDAATPAVSPVTEDSGDTTEPSRHALAGEASELPLQAQAAEPDATAPPPALGEEDVTISETTAPGPRPEDRPLPREEEPGPSSEPRVPIGAADHPPIPPEEKTSPWPRILIAALAFVIIGGGVVFYALNRNPDQPPPAQEQAERTTVQPQPSERDDSANVATAGPDTAAASQTTPPGRSTASAPTEAAASATGIDYAAGGYTLVVASDTRSTAAVSMAQQFSERFQEQAYPVEIISSSADGVLRYRVAIGQFQTIEEADAIRRRLASELPEGTWVMAIPPSGQ